MRAGRQVLLDLLRGGLQPDTIGDVEWAAVLDAAEQESILPYAAERLRGLAGECPPVYMRRLDEIRREAEVSGFIWTETLKNALRAFHRARLPVISLKGPCLAERLYGDAALRTCHDLDLLVRRSDFARAGELLTSIGYAPHSRGDDYHRPWRRKAIILELHHDVENPNTFAFDVDGAWKRARLSEFHGAPVRLLSEADELLYLCLHAVRHRFDRLSLIVDLTLAFRRFRLPLSGEPAWSDPVFENVVALGWMMAKRLASQIETPGILRVGPRNRKRLEQLADRIWQEQMFAPPAILDWAAQHRFFLEVETPGWNRMVRRWRYLRILLTRVIDDDFIFAERFNFHRDWQVRMLRPVRLAIKGMRGSPRGSRGALL